MIGAKLRRVGYAWLVIQGVASLLLPKQTLAANLKLWRVVENPRALELKPWYVTKLRAMGAGMIAAGLTGLLLERRGSEDEADGTNVAIKKVK